MTRKEREVGGTLSDSPFGLNSVAVFYEYNPTISHEPWPPPCLASHHAMFEPAWKLILRTSLVCGLVTLLPQLLLTTCLCHQCPCPNESVK